MWGDQLMIMMVLMIVGGPADEIFLGGENQPDASENLKFQ